MTASQFLWCADRLAKSMDVSVPCFYYVLSPEDFGEVPFATRTIVGDWMLYKSSVPYKPCDVFGIKELEAMRRRAAASHELWGG